VFNSVNAAAATRLGLQLELFLPLLLSLWIAWGDVKTRRIPNYLTLASALAGLGFQLGYHGWPGLKDGALGLVLGFGLLMPFYLMGGLGAGDVKALAAMGAWLGPWRTLILFAYMGFAGGVLALGVLWWRGLLGAKLRQAWIFLVNHLLLRHGGAGPRASPYPQVPGIPYGVALALGMAVLCWRGP
jgi:prepilin peptidase CpaA